MVEITEIFGFTLVMPLLLPCTLEMSLEFVTVFFQSSYENWVGSTYRLGRKSPLSSPLALTFSLELSQVSFFPAIRWLIDEFRKENDAEHILP